MNHQVLIKLLIQADVTLCLEIHRLFKILLNKELPLQWKESIIVPVYKTL
jgi:hypothetical protein